MTYSFRALRSDQADKRPDTTMCSTSELVGEQPQRWIKAQLVVIVDILVAQCKADDALANQCHQRVFDVGAVPAILKAARNPSNQIDRPIRLVQQQGTGIRAELATIKCRDQTPNRNGWLRTLCQSLKGCVGGDRPAT